MRDNMARAFLLSCLSMLVVSLPNEAGPPDPAESFVRAGSPGAADTTHAGPPDAAASFVYTENGEFVVNGEEFRFSGTNAYYLPNYEKLDPRVVDRTFDAIEEAGITVVRMWAFYDGYDCGYSRHNPEENVIQTKPGEYSESALRDLDRVIAKGKQRGIKFILPFINYWNELGGICQYNTWAGASNPDKNMFFFLNHPDTQKWFKDYIRMLLNRVNTVTGVAYKDEPAILSWQIMGEGRNPGEDPAILRDWYREMAQYIKSIDSNHLLGTGEEGFDEGIPSEYSVDMYSNTYALRSGEGTSYTMNTAIPEIDYGNAHWYASEYGFGYKLSSQIIKAQQAWISDHSAIAKDQGKPFVLGEYGFPGWGDERVLKIYDELWKHAEKIKLNGSLLWQLTADGTKCYESGGNICYPGGRKDRRLFNNFREYTQQINIRD
ncbi:MAG: cellulase family glycosylhydrolase [Balneolaceae bacterium]